MVEPSSTKSPCLDRRSTGQGDTSHAPANATSEQLCHLASLFHNASDPIVWISPTDGTIVHCNRASTELFGRGRGTLVGAAYTGLFGDAIRSSYEALFEDQGFEVEHQVEITTQDGEIRIYRIAPAVVPALSERSEGIIQMAFRNVTDEVDVARRLQWRSEHLATVTTELRDLTYLISHDLRAPMVNLKGFAGELRMAMRELKPLLSGLPETPAQGLPGSGSQEEVTESIDEALEFIDSSVARMERMIGTLLRWSRLERISLRPERIETAELVRDIVKTLQHQVSENRATITVHELPAVTADRAAMEQVLGNLIDNALKYLRNDVSGEVHIRCAQQQKQYVFSVQDNGRGLAEGELNSVFVPFRRLHRAGPPGEGMGLAYARSLVRRQLGQIWCESEPGVGTTFSFSIPEDLEKELTDAVVADSHDRIG